MRRAFHRLALAAALALAGGGASAMGFAEAFAAARANDATFSAAGHELESQRQLVPITRSALLPQVSLNASTADVSGTRQFFNSQNQEVTVQVGYASPQSSLQMRMPLYNRESSKRYEQAQAQVEMAESIYRTRGLELIDRVGTTYLQVLLAMDNRALAESHLTAARGQLTRAEQRFKRGEGTRTEQALAQANVDVARVRLIESGDQLEIARRNFKRLIGQDTPSLNQLDKDFIPGELVPQGLVEWLDLALRNSAAIRARQQGVIVAGLNIERQSAGHHPRVDFVASIARNENDSLSNLGQTSVLKSLGVQLSVPLYSGGGVDASVKQALADKARAEAELKAERENVEVELQRNYMLAVNGATRVTAYRQAAASSEVAYQGAVRTQEAGLGTISDVLDAQIRLYVARRDLAQSRYDYLLSRLRLMAQAGLPIDEIVADLDRLLVQVPGTP